jgi:hypothetical protein
LGQTRSPRSFAPVMFVHIDILPVHLKSFHIN